MISINTLSTYGVQRIRPHVPSVSQRGRNDIAKCFPRVILMLSSGWYLVKWALIIVNIFLYDFRSSLVVSNSLFHRTSRNMLSVNVILLRTNVVSALYSGVAGTAASITQSRLYTFLHTHTHGLWTFQHLWRWTCWEHFYTCTRGYEHFNTCREPLPTSIQLLLLWTASSTC